VRAYTGMTLFVFQGSATSGSIILIYLNSFLSFILFFPKVCNQVLFIFVMLHRRHHFLSEFGIMLFNFRKGKARQIEAFLRMRWQSGVLNNNPLSRFRNIHLAGTPLSAYDPCERQTITKKKTWDSLSLKSERYFSKICFVSLEHHLKAGCLSRFGNSVSTTSIFPCYILFSVRSESAIAKIRKISRQYHQLVNFS
jgi:hypothetical protein